VHEASIVESLLRSVVQNAPVRSQVARVHVRVGCLSGVSPDALQFYFRALREEPIGNQAELVIERQALVARCTACGKTWTFAEQQWFCPGCKDGVLDFENGTALDLVAIEVNDAGDDPDRTEDPRQQ